MFVQGQNLVVVQYHLTMQYLSMQHLSMQHLSVQYLSMQHLSVKHFIHTTFVQGQNLVVYKCNHSCLDQTIKFQTSYKAKPKLGQLQLMLSLAQLSPSLFNYFNYFGVKTN